MSLYTHINIHICTYKSAHKNEEAEAAELLVFFGEAAPRRRNLEMGVSQIYGLGFRVPAFSYYSQN